MINRLLHLTLIAMMFLGAVTSASEDRTRAEIHLGSCEEYLDPKASSQIVLPWFERENPATPAYSKSDFRHGFNKPIHFSADGKFLYIRHENFSDSVQFTVRKSETGEKVFSSLWLGRSSTDLRESIVDGEKLQMAAISMDYNNGFRVFALNGHQANAAEILEIPPYREEDEILVEKGRNGHSLHSGISLDFPYFVRTEYGNPSRRTGGNYVDGWTFAAQIVDWRQGRTMNLPTAAIKFLERVDRPFNQTFRYAAILQNDGRTLKLLPFSEIERAMRPADLPDVKLSLEDQIQAIVRKFFSRTRKPTPEPEIPFGGSLVHEEPVEGVVTSEKFPVLATMTRTKLTLWNAETGALLKSTSIIPESIRILDSLGLLFIEIKGGQILIYSFKSETWIGDQWKPVRASNSKSYLTPTLDGPAYLHDAQGKIQKITEDSITETGIQVQRPANASDRAIVRRGEKEYFVLIRTTDGGGKNSKLALDFFALDGSGHQVLALKYPIFSGGKIAVSPDLKTVAYTIDDLRTGILRLDQIMAEYGF